MNSLNQRKYSSFTRAAQQGLTLVELVVTVVLMGILAGGTVAYVVSSTQSYVDTATRNQLSAIARLTVSRLELDMGGAVPNSIRVTSPIFGNQCVEFFPAEDVTRYISVNFGSPSTSLTVMPFAKGASMSGQKFPVIFPISAADLYAQNNPGPLGVISNYGQSVSSGIETLTLSTSHLYQPGSNRKKVFLASQPVSFCIQGQKMYRYKNYGVKSSQCTPSTPSCLPTTAPNRAVVSDNLVNSGITAFEFIAPSLQRNGLVRINLNFSEGSEALLIQHEVRLKNGP